MSSRRFLWLMIPVAILIGVFAYNLETRDLFAFQNPEHEAEITLRAALSEQRPFVEINFSALYGNTNQLQLLHPLLDLQRLQFKMPEPVCTSTGTGFYEKPALFTLRDRTKQDLFDEALRTRTELPSDFVSQPPYIDRFGNSYAALLASQVDPYNQAWWVVNNLSFFKASELKEVLTKYKIQSPQYDIIAGLNPNEIEEVVKGSPLVLTTNYLLVKNDSRFGFSPLSYFVYNLFEFRNSLAKGSLDLVPASEASLCLLKVGNVCWTYNSKHVLSFLYRYSLAFILLVSALLAGLAFLYGKYLTEKSRERKKHRLSLQVLSHEFRTPVAALMLLTEQLAKSRNQLSEQDQDTVTRISSEVYQLQRIIEVSKTYLQAEGHKIPFQFVEISSINDWIRDFISESRKDVKFLPLTNDRKLEADPFWLKYVLSNLIQNAFAHGKPPVVIRLGDYKGGLEISVEDHGTCEFNSIREMSDAFIKSSKSQGMGLGLNITNFIVNEWGQDLEFSKSPTTFKFSLADRNS